MACHHQAAGSHPNGKRDNPVTGYRVFDIPLLSGRSPPPAPTGRWPSPTRISACASDGIGHLDVGACTSGLRPVDGNEHGGAFLLVRGEVVLLLVTEVSRPMALRFAEPRRIGPHCTPARTSTLTP